MWHHCASCQRVCQLFQVAIITCRSLPVGFLPRCDVPSCWPCTARNPRELTCGREGSHVPQHLTRNPHLPPAMSNLNEPFYLRY
jgi:hypothetical protein